MKNNLNIDLGSFVKTLKQKKKISIDGGYGKIKGKTFRISNMGDETTSTINHLLDALDEVIKDFLPS